MEQQVSAAEVDNPDADVPGDIGGYRFDYPRGSAWNTPAYRAEDRQLREICLAAKLPQPIAKRLHAVIRDPANDEPRTVAGWQYATRIAEHELKGMWGEDQYAAKMAAFGSVFKESLTEDQMKKLTGWLNNRAGNDRLLIAQVASLGERRAAEKAKR